MKAIRVIAALSLGVCGAAHAKDAEPLFRSNELIRLTIKGPVGAASDAPKPATLTMGPETLPITFAARGITRRLKDTCTFPPLRVVFNVAPPMGVIVRCRP